MTMTHDAHAAIDDLYRQWSDAIRRRRPDELLELLTGDWELWAAGSPPVTRTDVVPMLAAALERYDVTPAFECHERIVAGEWAFDRGWDVQTMQPRDGGAAVTRRQRVFLILRKGDDGRWRFARGMSAGS
jgi:ketosteroid isomerase-like protein